MNFSVLPSRVSFKSGYYQQSSDKPCYKTNRGMVAGAMLSTFSFCGSLFLSATDPADCEKWVVKQHEKKGLDINDKAVKESIEQYKNLIERKKRFAAPLTALSVTCTLGSGLLYDKIRNEKEKIAAKYIALGDLDSVKKLGGEVATSQSGDKYFKSKDAVKYGILSGVGCGLMYSAMDSIMSKKFNIKRSLLSTAILAVCGVLVSSVVQHYANDEAERYSFNV